MGIYYEGLFYWIVTIAWMTLFLWGLWKRSWKSLLTSGLIFFYHHYTFVLQRTALGYWGMSL